MVGNRDGEKGEVARDGVLGDRQKEGVYNSFKTVHVPSSGTVKALQDNIH